MHASFARYFNLTKTIWTDAVQITARACSATCGAARARFQYFMLLVCLFWLGGPARVRAEMSAVSAQNISLGVGAITDSLDQRSDSFSLVRYLKDHPIQIGDEKVDSKLVDHPRDSDYSVNGSADSFVGFTWTRADHTYHYQWSTRAVLIVRKAGAVIDRLRFENLSGGRNTPIAIVGVESEMLAPLWEAARTDIAKSIAKDQRGAR